MAVMELLPPAPSSELVTKTDLRLELQALEARLSAGFHQDMVRQTWVCVATTLTALGILGGLWRR